MSLEVTAASVHNFTREMEETNALQIGEHFMSLAAEFWQCCDRPFVCVEEGEGLVNLHPFLLRPRGALPRK